MKNKFNVVEGYVPATPRSRRKETSEPGGRTVIVSSGGSGGSGNVTDPNSHTHTNYALLERLSEEDRYLLLREENPETETNPDAEPFINEKIKAGHADDSDKWDGKQFSDYLDQSVRKNDEVVHKKVTAGNVVVEESVSSKDFRQGDFSGSGFGAYRDRNGNAVLEADILKIRKEAIFNEAVINQVTFRVGATVFSNGGCEITRVEELETAFRCYYDNKEGRRYSGLTTGDQVRCQRYDPTQHAIIKYYWRLVTAVGEDYVELSKSDADGSASPEAGDEIAQFGNRSDITRQSAIVINPLDGGSVEVYAHIDAYSLSEKNYVGMGVNPQTGEAYMYAYGDMFFGDRDLANPNASWITYQKKEGEERRRLRIKADVTFGADSSGLGNLSEFKAQQQQIDDARKEAEEAKKEVGNIQFSAVNIVDNSKIVTVTAPDGNNYIYKGLLTTEDVRAGEQFALSVGNIDIIAGAPTKFTFVLANIEDAHTWLTSAAELTADNRNAVFSVFEDVVPQKAFLLIYAGPAGATSGNIVRFDEIMLVRGNKPALSWSPSIADQQKYTDDKVNGIQIGGVNLLNDSRSITIGSWWIKYSVDSGATIVNEKFDGYDCLVVKNKAVGYVSGVFHNSSGIIEKDGYYAASVYIHVNKPCSVIFGVEQSDKYQYDLPAEETNRWIRVQAIQKSIRNDAAFIFYIRPSEEGTVAAFRMAKVETGNKVTAWTPSIADQEKYTDDKVDGIQIGSVNLLDGSREFTVTAGSGDNYKFQVFDIGEVEAGEVFALSVENISVLAGTPGELSVRMYNEGASKDLANYVEISTEERTALFTIKSDVTKQKAKVLFYAGKYAATAGNSVRYEGAVLVRGNKPALSWSPSIADQEKYADQAVNGVETLIDASKLDQNTYYPVTIKLNGIARSKITVRVNLSDTQPGNPVWGTYNENRFSCQAVWYNNGNSWGSNYDKRVVEEYQHRYADGRPIGSVGQMTNSSNEYIYVRGGGVYRFLATNAGTPVLHTEAYTVDEQTVDIKTSVEPLVSLQEQANSTQQEAETTRQAIADMNDDTIFDVSEKQSIRTQWENISGYARTNEGLDGLPATDGSYYRVRDMAKAAGISTAGLSDAVKSLRVKLNDYALYTASNTPGFDRAGLAVLFTAYYAQEIDVLNAVSQKYTDGKVADIETSMKDYDYLKLVFPNNTVDNNGVFLSRLMAVKNGTSASAAVVAGLYGGGVDSLNNAGFKDPTHGILMMFAGATSIQNVAAAKTRIYGDGSLFTKALYADGGTIGGFTITDRSLTITHQVGSATASELYLSYDLIRFLSSSEKTAVYMGPNSLPTSAFPNTICPVRVENIGSDSKKRWGIYLDVTNGTEGIALMVANGRFSGFRPMSRSYDNGTYTLKGNEEETVFFVNTSKGSTTFYLPSNPQPDQRYEIRKLHSGNSIIINAQNNGDIYVTGSNNPSSQISWTGRRCVTIQYSKNLDAWVMWFSYEA